MPFHIILAPSGSRTSENIVRALRDMGCPSSLQANQIQGSDFNAIFPVVQWLVKKVIENREATGDQNRKGSEAHFARHLGDITGSSSAVAEGAASASAMRVVGTVASPYLGQVAAKYQPRRRFQRSQELWSAGTSMGALARVQACLLEYGEKFAPGTLMASSSGDADGEAGASDFDRKVAAMQRAAREDEARRTREAADLEARMLGQMSASSGGKVSGRGVRRLVGLGEDGLREASAELREAEEALRREAESGELLANSRVGRAQAHKRRAGKLGKTAEKAELRAAVAREELGAAVAELTRVQAALRDTEDADARVSEEMSVLEARARELGRYDEWMELRRLMATVVVLTSHEREFKATCKRQLADLTDRIERLRANDPLAAGESELGARLAAAEADHADAEVKHRRLRVMLAKRSREIARLQRVIDDVPSRAELLQYEKRFEELYEALNAKTEEIRKQYASYNTLNLARQYLVKEEGLIRSMHESFAASMRSQRTQQAFLDQCEKILEGVRALVGKQAETLSSKRTHRDAKAVDYEALSDEQRAYFRAVKMLQAEADRGERLVTALEAAGLSVEPDADVDAS